MRKCTNIEKLNLQSQLADIVLKRKQNKTKSNSLRVQEHRLRKILQLIEDQDNESTPQNQQKN